MATKFLEPGGDATFGKEFWETDIGTNTVVSDFVHGNHQRSFKILGELRTRNSVLADSGTRISFYLYINALPSATNSLLTSLTSGGAARVFGLRITSGGVLQLWNGVTAQIGSNGSHTLTTGTWYRISLAYTITNSTTNRFELFVDGSSDISITNATLTNTGTSQISWGNLEGSNTIDPRYSDLYVDDSNALTDPGNIWVTAKRPNANGATNDFTTQIGSGGSGYGSGHSPQVNERAVSTTNGWSVVSGGFGKIEEYTVESASTGDIDISGLSLVDYMGWVYAKTSSAVTAQIEVNASSSVISLTTTATVFTLMAGSTSYPSTSQAIGLLTGTTGETISLYDCGIVIAYISVPPPNTIAPPTQLATFVRELQIV